MQIFQNQEIEHFVLGSVMDMFTLPHITILTCQDKEMLIKLIILTMEIIFINGTLSILVIVESNKKFTTSSNSMIKLLISLLPLDIIQDHISFSKLLKINGMHHLMVKLHKLKLYMVQVLSKMLKMQSNRNKIYGMLELDINNSKNLPLIPK